MLGVYPSALHVRWTLPTWATAELDVNSVVGALAVADEPTVFWHGEGADALVESWKFEVGFRTGDRQGDWGFVEAAGNGTSGETLRKGVLDPLGVTSEQTWFTDAVNTFFVKKGASGSRGGKPVNQQADVLATVYTPFATRVECLEPATLPPRPSAAKLVDLAKREHRDRLRNELAEAQPSRVVTLGEEARAVLACVVDDPASGPPTTPLAGADSVRADYGRPGEVHIGDWSAEWYALIHPGNRDPRWTSLHKEWIERVSSGQW